MHLRQTRFGYEMGHFDKLVAVAATLEDRMGETTGLHSIAIVKMSETEGQILAYYESKEDMKKRRGLVPQCASRGAPIHHPCPRRSRI